MQIAYQIPKKDKVQQAFINTQTVTPFTSTQRMFNMKEANSTKNCVSCLSGSGENAPVKVGQRSVVIPITETPDIQIPKVPVVSPDGSVTLKLSNKSDESQPNPAGPSGPSGPSESVTKSTNDNYVPQDFTYNSYEDWRAPNYNQWTRIYDDNCNEENRLRIGSKPMKYFVNEFNSPQSAPFVRYTVVGNQKEYDVRNDYERAIPTRLNPIYPVSVLPYNTTPFLGAPNAARTYVDTDSNLRWGSDLKNLKSTKGNTEVDFNRWNPGVYPQTVQNAGQFAPGGRMQQAMPARTGDIVADNVVPLVNTDGEGYYDPNGQNNVIFGNSAFPYFGVSSRNLLHNIVDLSGC